MADENLLVREGLMGLLAPDPAIDVVAMAGDLPSVADACARLALDVVCTGIRMPPTRTDEGVRLAVALRERYPQIGVVVLSLEADSQHALALLERGSVRRAYLLKDRVHNRAELTAAIRAVADGGSVIDPTVVELLIRARTQLAASPLRELTPREREVLEQIAQGKSNGAVAASLFLSKRAVEKHINAIFLKLGLTHGEDSSKRVKAVLMLLGYNGLKHAA